jgi:hypothetical protein
MKFMFKPSKNKFFDFKIGLAGGLVMGIVIFCINYFETYNLTGSITASLKQGVYTFLFGGSIMKLCETIALKINNYYLAVMLAMVVPSAISLLLTYGVHSLKGTPLPLESTIPTAIFVIPSTLIWAAIKRKPRKAI